MSRRVEIYTISFIHLDLLVRFLDHRLNIFHKILSLLVIGSRGCALSASNSTTYTTKQHELCHKIYLLLPDAINFLLMSEFFLQLCQALSHNNLIFVCKTWNYDFLHSIHHSCIDICRLKSLHLTHHVSHHALVLGTFALSFLFSLQ